jgi:thiol:disulfide interchange protein DsbD
MFTRHLGRLCLLILLTLSGPALAQSGAETKVTLLVQNLVAPPDSTVLVAVQMEMPAEWHTYWSNPSDGNVGGVATSVRWELPAGITAGPIQWPIPHKISEQDGHVYAYEGRVALIVPLSIASNAPAGLATLKARVSWLECKTACVKGTSDVSATLQIGPASVPSTDAGSIAQYERLLPEPQRFPVQLQWITGKDPNQRTIRLSFSAREGVWDFYPEVAKDITFDKSVEGRPSNEQKVLVSKDATSSTGIWPDQISGLLVKNGPDGHATSAYRVQGRVSTGKVLDRVTDAVPELAPSFAKLLFFAFLGGLILNIMPCVLPVIALKILSFVKQGQESASRIRKLGLMYGVGVLASFAVLAGVMISLSLANRSVHQGVLFQSSTFLVIMAILVVLISLNLFGVFEVTFDTSNLDGASTLARKEGYTGAFFNGVLATALATPCSAPFLSLSLGFALQPGQKPSVTLLMYLMAGVGLALPYVILCFQPRWLKLLPKPGNWMVRFKVLMGFPMLATAVWLFLLAGNHYDKESMLWLGLFLIVVALAAWMFGEFVQRGTTLRKLSGLLVAALVLGGYVWMLESEADWRHPPTRSATPSVGNRAPGKHKIPWGVWSPEAVKAARSEGHPVFVDFTADYCTTCHQNTRFAIEVPAVMAKLQLIGAVTLLGDFSLDDPLIAAELRTYRRSGVPLVLVYSINADEPPRVMPELLSEKAVLAALEWASTVR